MTRDIERMVWPHPHEIEERSGEPLLLKEGFSLTLPAPLADWAKRRAAEFWHVTPAVTTSVYDPALPPQSYEITVSQGGVVIKACDAAGVRYALFTLRQLAEPERGAAVSRLWQLVPCRIVDHPDIRFRGIVIVHYPESELYELEKKIRLAAYYKYTHAVIEFRGCFPFETCPELCFADGHADRSGLKQIVKVAAELGLELIPLYNMLGHGTGVGIDMGKHVTLDRYPELGPLFEPDGWSFCLANPNVRPFLEKAFLEMYDFFDHPKFFHIGCDEPFNVGSCSLCRHHDVAELVKDHLLFLHDLAAKHDCRLILWHDAFIDQDRPDYQGYVIHDREGGDFHSIVEELPRDLIFDYWQYDYPTSVPGGVPTWKPADRFKELGFDTLLSPWNVEETVRSMANKVVNDGLFGMMQTSWYALNGSINYMKMLARPANLMWNLKAEEGTLGDASVAVSAHVRHVCRDMNLVEYRKSGTRKEMNFA